MKTKEIKLTVNAELAAEWQAWIGSVPGTHLNPVNGDRILTAAYRVIEGEQASARRRWKEMKGAREKLEAQVKK